MDDSQARENRLALKEVPETSADQIASLLEGGTLELVIEGAFSEWGSLLEEFTAKLERGVTTWADGEDKRVVLHFSETQPQS